MADYPKATLPTTSKLRQTRRKIISMEVSEGVRKKLREGETLYFTDKPPHNGKFVAYARWKDSFGRPHRSSTRSFSSDKEALAFLVSLRQDQLRLIGKYSDRPLRDWFDYCAEKRWPNKISSVTISNKKGRWKKYIEPYLGSALMKAITLAVVVSWLEELGAKGAPPSQVIEAKNDLYKLYEDAIDFEEYDRNPVRNTELAKPELRSKSVLTTEELAKFLSSSTDAVTKGEVPAWIVAMSALGFLAGLRKGEIQALCWGSNGVDLVSGFINITCAAQRDENGELSIGLPKAGKKRRVPIPTELNLALKLVAPTDLAGACSRSDLLFPSRTGRMIHPKQVREKFELLKTTCNLPVEMQFRDTRATYASLLDSIALGQKTTLELMGHESTTTTTERYMESQDSAKKAAAKAISNALKKTKKPKASSTPHELLNGE